MLVCYSLSGGQLELDLVAHDHHEAPNTASLRVSITLVPACHRQDTCLSLQIGFADHAETLEIVVDFLSSESYEEAHLSASILWALAPAAGTRTTLTALGAIKKLLSLLNRTLAVCTPALFS